ncbi:hypothetical protein JXL21_09465 [Candidatus Bathyarchaeota archaeon]|nr:hypothetical protein [Candidatus Bathyarchaeota archaeon]
MSTAYNRRAALAFLLVTALLSVPAAHGHVNASDASTIYVLYSQGNVTAVLVNSASFTAESVPELRETLLRGVPVLFYGEHPELFLEVYEPRLDVEAQGGDGFRLTVLGARLTFSGNRTYESVLRVWDSSYSQGSLESAYTWLNETETIGDTAGLYDYVGSSTDIHRHAPYGRLESRLEALRVLSDDSGQHDWYEFTVTQRVVPGAWGGSSGWRWSWVEYTMNGTAAGSNAYLSDYDQPASERKQVGLFTFLWRVLTFQWRDLLPLLGGGQGVEGVDMSDFSGELFRVRYEAYGGYPETDQPFAVRHRYVLRVDDGSEPLFTHQTQVRYVKGGSFSVERYITPPICGGFVRVRRQ